MNNLPNVKNLSSTIRSYEEYLNLSTAVQSLKDITLICIDQTMTQFNESKNSKNKKINMIFALEIVKMALLHMKLINIVISAEKVKQIPNEKLRYHVSNLTCLLTIIHLQEYCSIGYSVGYFKSDATGQLNNAYKELLRRIRPQFIPLIELLPYTDNSLCSAIGNSYGDIYETHLDWAKNSRLNRKKDGIQDGFMEHMMPIIRGKL